MQPPNPAVLTVKNGDQASFVIKLSPDQNTPTKSYNGTITMSDTSSPSIVTASTPTFTNPTVTLDGTGSGTTTLYIQTVARPVNSGSLFRRTSFYAAWLPIGGLSLAGLGIGAGRRRRRWIAGLGWACLPASCCCSQLAVPAAATSPRTKAPRPGNTRLRLPVRLPRTRRTRFS